MPNQMRNRFFFTLCVTFFCCAFFSCSRLEASASHPQAAYGEDANYYQGLRLLEEGNETEAVKKFNRAVKKGSYYANRRSMEQLTNLGNIQERIAACESLVKKFPDEDSYLIAARVYALNGEFSKLILMTDSIDVATCSNELAFLRMSAMRNKSDSRFSDSVYEWFVSRPFSAYHGKFFDENIDVLQSDDWHDATSTEDGEQNSKQDINQKSLVKRSVMTFRRETYQRDYQNAYAKSTSLREMIKDAGMDLPCYLVSDMGRAFLYSNNYFAEDVDLFAKIAAEAERDGNNLLAFYARFYAGRLSERAGNIATAKMHFEQAMAAARFEDDGERYDNALWYLLDCILTNTPDEVVPAVRTYCTQWHDASYFDDFFEKLSVQLFTASRWQDFRQLVSVIDGYATDKVTAQYAYVYARLLESGIASSGRADEAQIKRLYERATDAGGVSYYATLAGVKLGLTDEQILECVTMPSENVQRANASSDAASNGAAKNVPYEVDVNAVEKFLRGYAEFGLASYIYDEWRKFYDDGVRLSLETDEVLAKFLQQCGESTDSYYVQSLRIASRSVRNRTEKISEDMLRLVYPKDFEKLVVAAAEKYSLAPELLFALIHSESFFDAKAISSASAMGLTQLMEFTAADIAQRLRRKEYDVTNPEDSIEFGAYYLGNLIGRLDDLPLAALFAYNAGITRVRRWMTGAHAELRTNLEGNYDLFLETVPFAETRGYGRNVISAAVMYGMLHYGKSAATVVDELM